MKKISFPYGQTYLDYEFKDEELTGILTSSIEEYIPEFDGKELVRKALHSPVESELLCTLSKGKRNIVLLQVTIQGLFQVKLSYLKCFVK